MKAVKIARFVVFAIICVFVFGWIIMSLWNWLMPMLFGLRQITYWQALGVLLLSKILFGGFRGGGGHWHWRRRMWERWQHMSPEEREKFRERMRGRCGPWGEPEKESPGVS